MQTEAQNDLRLRSVLPLVHFLLIDSRSTKNLSVTRSNLSVTATATSLGVKLMGSAQRLVHQPSPERAFDIGPVALEII